MPDTGTGIVTPPTTTNPQAQIDIAALEAVIAQAADDAQAALSARTNAPHSVTLYSGGTPFMQVRVQNDGNVVLQATKNMVFQSYQGNFMVKTSETAGLEGGMMNMVATANSKKTAALADAELAVVTDAIDTERTARQDADNALRAALTLQISTASSTITDAIAAEQRRSTEAVAGQASTGSDALAAQVALMQAANLKEVQDRTAALAAAALLANNTLKGRFDTNKAAIDDEATDSAAAIAAAIVTVNTATQARKDELTQQATNLKTALDGQITVAVDQFGTDAQALEDTLTETLETEQAKVTEAVRLNTVELQKVNTLIEAVRTDEGAQQIHESLDSLAELASYINTFEAADAVAFTELKARMTILEGIYTKLTSNTAINPGTASGEASGSASGGASGSGGD